MSPLGALLAAHDVWSHSYGAHLIERGYDKTGIVAKPRSCCGRTCRPKPPLETKEAAALLDGIYRIPDRSVAPGCCLGFRV